MFQQMLTQLNWLHIAVAALAYFALGALWYSKLLFSAPWVKGHGINIADPNASKCMGLMFGGSFVLMFAVCVGLALVYRMIPINTAILAVKFGLFFGLFFSATTICIGYLYCKKPLSVHLIDGLYHTAGMIIASIILVLWK